MSAEQKTINDVMTAFEDFRRANDERLESASGAAEAATKQSNEAMQKVLDAERKRDEERAAERLEELENTLGRLDLTGRNARHELDDERMERYALFQAMVQGEDVDPAHVDLEFIKNYRDSFYSYMRGRTPLETLNEMSVGSDPGGGAWVDPDTSGRIIEFVRETSPIRQFTNPVVVTGDALEGDYDVQEAGTGGWVGETASRTGDTGTPEVWDYRIPLHEQYAEPRTTQKWLDMTNRPDAEGWLTRKVARKFGREENLAAVTGNGEAKPRGFVTYAAGTPTTTSKAAYTVVQQVVSGNASALTSDGIVDLVFALKSDYRAGAIFTGTRLTESEVRKLKDGQGNYLWQPDFTQRTNASLVGFPFVEFADMAEIAANALPLGFGNLADHYQPIDSGLGIRVLRDDVTLKSRVKFYTTKYFGGDVVDFDAFKLQKVST